MFFNKKLRQADKEIFKSQNLKLEKETEINLKAATKEQIFSDYDYDNNEKLNNELYEYIWDKAKFVPAHNDITIKVHTFDKVVDEEVESAIHNKFKNDFIETKIEGKRNVFFCISMFIIGLLSLAVLLLCYAYFPNIIVSTILEIATWVFMWEAVDAFFLKRREIKNKQIHLLRLCLSQIKVVHHKSKINKEFSQQKSPN